VKVKHNIRLIVNGESYTLAVEPCESLLYVLRDKLSLTGTKKGCNRGDCGACTIIMDGKTVNSCLVLAVEAGDKEVLTIEGLANKGQLHPIQEAFVQQGAVQCGYCTPGMIISAKALLDENPNPTEEEVRQAIGGNLCRCTGYVKIVDAVKKAAEVIQAGGNLRVA